ncbi:MAG: hypothetical protein ACRCXC_03285 [Legionella sp.]
MSLRSITVQANKRDLLNLIQIETALQDQQTTIEGSTIYGKFMELVHHYLYKKETLEKISQFNELALSPAVVKLA